MDSLVDIHHPVTLCKASAGTGKTYTLAAYYVGLLLSGEDYRSILAITFTNKATAEMSERILAYLYAISQGKESAFLAYARRFMIRDAQAPDVLLQERAATCFHKMLLDYDNMQVQTIDSFLQTLLGGLAGVLHMDAGIHTELDVKHVIQEAVEQLLATELTEADRVILEDYMQLKLDQESHWDVRQSLCDLAAELYNESVQMLDADGRILFDAQAIARRREAIEQRWEKDELVEELKLILRTCQPDGYNRYTKAAYERLKRSVQTPEKVSSKDRFRGVADKYCNADEMARASELAEQIRTRYNTLQLTIRFSRDMELMSSLQALIQRNLSEANCALLARTASTLTKALHTGDADFILEKAGIRFHHVLMDEFQDTSRLQWSVIEQLLRDVLASAGNTLLIVGDIKQSIYRWRNGDWKIMEGLTGEGMSDLTGERMNDRFTSLTRNFRSSEEVVRFNLTLFDHIVSQGDELTARIYSEGYQPECITQFYQADKKAGGCVRFKAVPNAKKEDLAQMMFEQIEDLLQKGTNPSDIMILVREKKEAALLCDMTDLPIVSADSFMLEASTDVQLIIAALRYRIHGDSIARHFITQRIDSPDIIGQIDTVVKDETPLYEAVCELVRVLLTDDQGRYTGSETAYVNAFLDRTREYVGAYGSNMEQFVAYWDENLHAKPIPVTSSNAIQIMTIHASKGLQAQTLFVPFVLWEREDGRHKPKVWCPVSEKVDETGDYVPVPFGTEMAESDYSAAYAEELINMRIDNLNMLYVALTRAEDNLFVYTSYSMNKDGKRGVCNHVGKYLMDRFGEEYEVGEPVIKQAKTSSNNLQTIDAELWANSDQVHFVQSQEGALYTENGEEAYRRVARMEEGTLCHEIFANIRKADELEQVLDDFETRGEIRDKSQREEIKSLISSAWEGIPKMREWFTAPFELRLEESIYIDERELRPDRVMVNPQTKEAIVLDYKFGSWNEHYKTQVREYKQALRNMGYDPVSGYLWFARENRLVEVKG